MCMTRSRGLGTRFRKSAIPHFSVSDRSCAGICRFAIRSDAKRNANRIPPAPDQAAVDRGQNLFSQNCSFCHGRDANGGDGGPDLIRSVLVNHDEHGNLISPVVLNGRPGKGMPKFNLTPAQISDIATFLHARNRYVRYRQLYQVKDVVTGDARSGEAYFNGAAAARHAIHRQEIWPIGKRV